jgi:hypothetical protein
MADEVGLIGCAQFFPGVSEVTSLGSLLGNLGFGVDTPAVRGQAYGELRTAPSRSV